MAWLCSWPPHRVTMKEGRATESYRHGQPKRRPMAAALDVALLGAGLAALGHFTLQFVLELGVF